MLSRSGGAPRIEPLVVGLQIFLLKLHQSLSSSATVSSKNHSVPTFPLDHQWILI